MQDYERQLLLTIADCMGPYCRFEAFSGPLHTQAKSRDHEIVRAQKKVSKGYSNTPPKSCSVVTHPHV